MNTVQQQVTPTSMMHRVLTAAMLSCFALGGWFWSQESSQKQNHATAATTSKPVSQPSASFHGKPEENLTWMRDASTTTQPTASFNRKPEACASHGNEPEANETTVTRYVTKNIEDIQLGQRLIGRNPLRHETSAPSDIDPANWRAIRLTMLQSGVFYELAFLRSLEWLAEADATVGQHIELVLPEMGLLGPALVESIEPCPTIEPDDGTGRMIVSGTMKHLATNILELTIVGLDEPLGVTTTHPIWSEDRQAFVTAGRLIEGELLRQANGLTAQLTRITPKRGPPELVYNLEVDAEHVYHVATTGLLVHNECAFERFVSPLEAQRSIATKGLHIDPKFNGKFKNIADLGTFNPNTLGPKSGKFFGQKITIGVKDGARDWLKANGVKAPLGHDPNTYQIPAHLVEQFNKLFVTGVK